MPLRARLFGGRSPEDAFAEEMRARLRKLDDVRTVERGDDFSLRIVRHDGRDTVMFLGNVFAEAQHCEGEVREALLQRHVLAMAPLETPTTWADAAPRLLPALRAVTVVASAPAGAPEPVRRSFAPFLDQLAVIDSEHAMAFVSAKDLAAWGVDADTVHATALANLSEHGVPVEGDESRLEIVGPDGYVSSWLLLPQVLVSLGRRMGGDFVALAPSRDDLRLVPTADAAALGRELEAAVADYEQAPRRLTPVPFAVVDGRLEEWLPDESHPCRVQVDRAGAMLALYEYETQRALLEEGFEREGRDVYVAQYKLIEREDSSLFAWTLWGRDVTDALLPRADHVALYGGSEDETRFVRWEDVERIAPGALVRERAYDPPRWRTTGWPDDAIVEELLAVSILP